MACVPSFCATLPPPRPVGLGRSQTTPESSEGRRPGRRSEEISPRRPSLPGRHPWPRRVCSDSWRVHLQRSSLSPRDSHPDRDKRDSPRGKSCGRSWNRGSLPSLPHLLGNQLLALRLILAMSTSVLRDLFRELTDFGY